MSMVRLIDNTDPRLPRLQPHGWAGPAEHIRALLLVSAAAAAIAGWPAAATAAGKLTRVSVGIGGAEANGGSGGATISANGRLVAFTSAASNLVLGDTNSASDVFVRDLQAGTTERVSVATGGAQGNGDSGDFYAPSMSADGRFVTFRSAATNLVKDDTNRYADIFVRDRQKGTTVRVSVSSGGVQANDASFQPVISAAGRFVVFSTPASNLVGKDTNSDFDVFLRDVEAGKTERVSVASGGAQRKGFSTPGGISSNGRRVIFWSDAPNLIKGDKNGDFDVFLRDRRTKKTTLVSISSSGAKANASNRGGWISGDGRYVVFEFERHEPHEQRHERDRRRIRARPEGRHDRAGQRGDWGRAG